jgi:hypothetical protein
VGVSQLYCLDICSYVVSAAATALSVVLQQTYSVVVYM